MYSDISFKTLFWVFTFTNCTTRRFRQYTHTHTHTYSHAYSRFSITEDLRSRRRFYRVDGGDGSGERGKNEINSIKRYNIRCFGDAFSRSSSWWSQGSTGPDARATASCRYRCGTKPRNTLCPSRNARSSLASPLPGTWSLSPRATPPTRCSSSRSRSPPSARSPIDSQPGAINCLCAV